MISNDFRARLISRFFAVDPGERTGIAIFEQSQLVDLKVVSHFEALKIVAGRAVVSEVPVVYPKLKVDPNALLKLAFKVGQISAVACAYELVEPRAWKGSLDKNVTARRAISALENTEAAVVKACAMQTPESYFHNALDALAIGLSTLDRVSFK